MKREVILESVVGSRAYGLNHVDSDTDTLGVFIAPTEKVAGLHWNSSKESWSNASPSGDDSTLHEIGKFIRLTLKGNPTLVELYFMDEYLTLAQTGQDLLNIRDELLGTREIRNAYVGYAISQVKAYRNADIPKDKMARHTLRIARQGRSLLESGELSVHVGDPAEYFELTKLPKETILKILEDEIEALNNCSSILPSLPNVDIAVDFLEDVRRDNILKGK